MEENVTAFALAVQTRLLRAERTLPEAHEHLLPLLSIRPPRRVTHYGGNSGGRDGGDDGGGGDGSEGDVTATSPVHSMQQQKWNGVQEVVARSQSILSKYLVKMMSMMQQSCGNKKHNRSG